ncbi:MAG: acetyl esterase/lipase, partial [Janthinobacterium sp.]
MEAFRNNMTVLTNNPGKLLLLLIAIIALLGGIAACSPLKVINAFSSGRASSVTQGLAYGSHTRQQLDIYTPVSNTGANGQTGAPVVVFFYGGNWSTGDRADYAFVGHALASRGIVAVIADYRLYPEIVYPHFLDDSAQALAWTVRHVAEHGGDPQQLFVMGHSAGAYNAAMLALDPRWLANQGLPQEKMALLRGWIGLAGPYNFIPIENKATRLVFPYPQTPANSQPIYHVSAAMPPALLIAASEDTLVNPQRNSGALANAYRALGVPVIEHYFDRVSHATLVASLAGPLRKLAPTL